MRVVLVLLALLVAAGRCEHRSVLLHRRGDIASGHRNVIPMAGEGLRMHTQAMQLLLLGVGAVELLVLV